MDQLTTPVIEQLPTAISSLIDGAVATFDTDRDTSRRYLQRASAILRARRSPLRPDRESPRVMTSRPGGLAVWQVNRVIDHVEKHLLDRIAAGDLADIIDVSRGQLSRAFKVSVGVTLSRFIAEKRIELACVIIQTTREPLSQVALACGLSDQSHLCRVFRRTMGTSPAAWRRANALDPSLASHG